MLWVIMTSCFTKWVIQSYFTFTGTDKNLQKCSNDLKEYLYIYKKNQISNGNKNNTNLDQIPNVLQMQQFHLQHHPTRQLKIQKKFHNMGHSKQKPHNIYPTFKKHIKREHQVFNAAKKDDKTAFIFECH